MVNIIIVVQTVVLSILIMLCLLACTIAYYEVAEDWRMRCLHFIPYGPGWQLRYWIWHSWIHYTKSIQHVYHYRGFRLFGIEVEYVKEILQ